MTRPAFLQVVTANDLLTGAAVWFTAEDGWSPDPAAAQRVSPGAADAVLARAALQEAKVVGPYLAPVTEDGAPIHFREVFRTRGPSNRPDLGKQAEA